MQTVNTQTPAFEITKGGNAIGTHLHGYITAKYSDIVKLLGKPDDNDGYKVDAEWILTINGKTITLYNYKDGKNYNGKSGLATSRITDWHIGADQPILEEATFLAAQLNGTFRSCY